MKKLFVLSTVIIVFTFDAGAQIDKEETTPRITAKNIKIDTIKDKRQKEVKFIASVKIKDIKKTNRSSNQLEKEELRLNDSLVSKLKIKDAEKYRIEKYRKSLNNTEPENVEPKSGFDINPSGAGNPPDNSVAVSHSGFIVAADNSQIGFYREDGTTLDELTYPDFLSHLDESIGNSTSDPKVIYDPEERKFIFFIQSGSSASSSQCVLAFSHSEDPTDGWNFYAFNDIKDDNLWFDYPSISVNFREVFLTGNLFNNNGDFSGNILYGFDKDDGYTGRNLAGTFWRDIKPNGSFMSSTSIFAVPSVWSSMYGPNAFFISTWSMGGGDVFLYEITNHLNNNPSLNKYTIDISNYEVARPAFQKNTNKRLDVGDCRIKGGYYQKGKIYFVFSKDDGHGFSGISYNRITLSNLNVKSKYFNDDRNSDYAYPAIAPRTDHSESYSRAVLVYLRSGSGVFPQIRKRLLKGNMSAVSGSTTIKHGANFRTSSNTASCSNICSCNCFRWGDYISIQRKFGTKRVWLVGHTPSASNSWRTHLISIDF